MYHSKKIGIFISHIFGSFQSRLCQGIIDKASEFGYTVEIFSSMDGEDVGSYSLGEASILRIPNFSEFSGICFASGTYLRTSLREDIARTLREKCTCPVIEIAQSDTVFPSIELDNDTAAGQLTEHMITSHRHRRVCYLGSSAEPRFSEKRFLHYRKTMERHGIPVSDADYCFCGYDAPSIEAALNHFLQTGKPDSIICYNDRMAVTLIDAIYRHGYRIPEDIAVTGFDDLEIGQNIRPALSTVTFPIYEMGQRAMELLLDAVRKIPLPATTVLTARPLYRSSCGCAGKADKPLSLYESRLMERIHTLEHSMLNDIKMDSTLCGVRDLEEGMELLEKFLPRIENLRELYICLYQNWDSVPSHIQEITSSPEEDDGGYLLIMPFAYRDGKPLPRCSFAKKSILPDYVYANSRSSYIYSPLYFQEREFGYATLSYQDNRLSYQFDFLTWIANVSRMLKNICDAKQTGLLVSRLEDIYAKDDLTGLYNRRGFSLAAETLLGQAKEETILLTMVFDLDGLKTINDRFGHREGNFALQVAGHALEHAGRKDMILARLGDDEFHILAAGLTDADAQEISLNVSRYLEHYNQLHTRKYDIRVSSGYAFTNAGDVLDLQELFDSAEQKMYEEKKAKKNAG